MVERPIFVAKPPASAPLQKQITDLYDRLAATTEGSPEQNSVYAELDWLVTLAELDRWSRAARKDKKIPKHYESTTKKSTHTILRKGLGYEETKR